MSLVRKFKVNLGDVKVEIGTMDVKNLNSIYFEYLIPMKCVDDKDVNFKENINLIRRKLQNNFKKRNIGGIENKLTLNLNFRTSGFKKNKVSLTNLEITVKPKTIKNIESDKNILTDISKDLLNIINESLVNYEIV